MISQRGTQKVAVSLGVGVGQRSETIRRSNLSAIVRELHAHGPLSRSELVERTGLTRSAVRGLIGELTAGGLATERRGAPLGGPGRPSVRVAAKSAGAEVLALEIAVDSLAAAIVGLGGQVRQLVRVERPRGHLAVDDLVRDLRELAVQICPPPIHPGRLLGVGVAVVGVVRRSDGFVPLAPNLGWHNVALGDAIAVALGSATPVAVANEADLGALAELRRGAAVGERDVLYISGEVGVGGGIFVDGRPLTGAAGFAGEVGHMPVNPAGGVCGCGSTGCWETEIGERALLQRAGRAVDGGREAVEDILAAAAEQDARSLAALNEVGRWLGRGLAGLVNVFNPRLVVLGGLFGRVYFFVAPAVEEQLDRFALPAAREIVRLAPAALGVNAPLIGAAELAFEPLLAEPAAWLRRDPRRMLASA
jgi:predicted NBD/HSP70 family sugar kinase